MLDISAEIAKHIFGYLGGNPLAIVLLFLLGLTILIAWKMRAELREELKEARAAVVLIANRERDSLKETVSILNEANNAMNNMATAVERTGGQVNEKVVQEHQTTRERIIRGIAEANQRS